MAKLAFSKPAVAMAAQQPSHIIQHPQVCYYYNGGQPTNKTALWTHVTLGEGG
jgi:hypothetical protein